MKVARPTARESSLCGLGDRYVPPAMWPTPYNYLKDLDQNHTHTSSYSVDLIWQSYFVPRARNTEHDELVREITIVDRQPREPVLLCL